MLKHLKNLPRRKKMDTPFLEVIFGKCHWSDRERFFFHFISFYGAKILYNWHVTFTFLIKFLTKLGIVLPLKTRTINKYIESVSDSLGKTKTLKLTLNLNQGQAPNLHIFFLLYLLKNFFIYITDFLLVCWVQ